MLLRDSVERHHAAVEQVCDLALHLHVDVLDEHAVHDGDGLEVDREFLELGRVALDVLDLGPEHDVHVTLVAGPLALEAPDVLLDVALDVLELILSLVLGALDLSRNLVVKLLIRNANFCFNFAYLGLNDLISLLDLKVCNLRDKRFYFVSYFFNELATLRTI